MERLTNLVETLSSLKEVSNAILSNMLPIMEEIAQDDNDATDEVVNRADVDKKDVDEYLQATTLEIITDAEIVKKEIDAFAEAAGEGKGEMEAKIASYPFLADVWYGDLYDGKEGIDALQSLLADLKSEQAKTTEDWIIENAIAHFTVVAEA